MHKVLSGLLEGWWMFFDTLWALVLGFVLSGLVQALISRERMQQILGDHKPKTIAKAGFYGMVSSSCSYAASALSRSIFIKGGDFTAAMVFMFASTNLVIELGIVLWFLIGWQFALAEFVGGAIMIVLIALVIPRLISREEIEGALLYSRVNDGSNSNDSDSETDLASTGVNPAFLSDSSLIKSSMLLLPLANEGPTSVGDSNDPQELESRKSFVDFKALRKKLTAAAGFTIGDFTMLRVELVIGFIVAGLATTLVPFTFWRSLFLSGHGFWSVLENSIIGPFLAFISFVCSVGNVPLAAALWSAGITFGGVIAFIFADLLAFPLVMIYRKYYGNRFAFKLALIFWAIMALSGMATEGIFNLLGITPTRMSLMDMTMTHYGWNATTVLNGIALLLMALVTYLHLTRGEIESGDFAEDPICGMQVRKSDAPASVEFEGKMYYFCMDGCRTSFLAKRA